MNKLSSEQRTRITHCIVEGNSLRATARLCGVSFNTVLKFVPTIGQACSDYQDRAMRGLTCNRLELDEQWNLCYAKAKNLPEDKRGVAGFGDIWTWIALDADTKLIPTWLVSDRSAAAAHQFVDDLKSRIVNRPQISTDGHHPYLAAIETAFGNDVDFAQIIKIYSTQVSGQHTRYSQPACTGVKKKLITGDPNEALVSTSYVERVNLSVRMNCRRCTRLTNAHSKKAENHNHAMSLFFMFYNFCRVHQTLRCTPAMQAGITNHVWEISEIVALLDSPASSIAA